MAPSVYKTLDTHTKAHKVFDWSTDMLEEGSQVSRPGLHCKPLNMSRGAPYHTPIGPHLGVGSHETQGALGLSPWA